MKRAVRRPTVFLLVALVTCMVAGVAAVAVAALPSSPSNLPLGATAPTRSGPSAVGELAALSRPAVPSDKLPPSLSTIASNLGSGTAPVDQRLRPGALELDRSRKLLSTAQGGALYAVPTSTGHVCYFAVGAGAGCVASFEDLPGRVAWFAGDPDRVGAGEPATVGGVVPDDVTGVDVTVNGEVHAATLANNGFVFHLDDPAAWPESITISYEDGTIETVALNAPPRNP